MAYSFLGTSQQSLISSESLTLGTPCTLACWFRVTTTVTASQVFISVNATNNDRVLIRTANATIVAITVDDGSGNALAQTPSFITPNVWYHACGVFNAFNSRTIYRNGANPVTNTAGIAINNPSFAIIGATRATSAQPAPNTFINHLTGNLADVGIWNAALSPDEIASLARGIACDRIRPQSLVVYAPLVRNLIDKVGGTTFTNTNGATVAAHPRVYA